MKNKYILSLVASIQLLITSPAIAENAVVLNSGDATVSLIDTKTFQLKQTFNVGKEPHHLMPTPDDSSLIVASSMGNELLFLDPKSGVIQKKVTNIVDPYQIGFSPDKKWLVSTALRLDHVDIYQNTAAGLTLSKRLMMPKTPSHIAFTKDSQWAFITLQGSDQVSAIDLRTQTIKWTIPVGKLPAGIMLTPNERYLLVGIMGGNYVEVIDWRAQKTISRIVTGEGAHNFRALGDKRMVFVSNRVSNTISLLDLKTFTVVGEIKLPYGGPDCMDVSADGKTLWTTLRWGKKVAVVDIESRKVLKTIPVGRSPHGVYFSTRAGNE